MVNFLLNTMGKHKVKNDPASITALITKKYQEAYNYQQKKLGYKTSFLAENKEKVLEAIHSRGCYRQYIRLFNSSTPKRVTPEAFQLAKSFKEAGFDITKVKNIGIQVQNCYREIKKLEKEDKLNVDNSILRIYLHTIEILSDAKIRNKIVAYDKRISEKVKDSIVLKSKDDMNRQKELLQLSYVVISYVNLLYLASHLTVAIVSVCAELAGDVIDVTPLNINKLFYSRYYSLFIRSALHHIPLLIYFEKIDLNELEKQINLPIDEQRAKEEWEIINNSLINPDDYQKSQEFTGLANAAFHVLKTNSVVQIMGIVLISALGLSILIPIIRGLIYYWGSVKIDISKQLEEDAVFFTFNVQRLKDQLNQTKDEKTRNKLIKTIEKQERYIEKLKQNSLKLSIEYEDATKEAVIIAEEDEKIEENDSYDYYTPDVVL